MNKNLTIDIGNTCLKYGIFENSELIEKRAIVYTPTNLLQELDKVLENSKKYRTIICVSVIDRVYDYLHAKNIPNLKIIDFEDYPNLIQMNLGNPPMLKPFAEVGSDIVVGAYAGRKLNLTDFIVVDAGTAITVTAVVNKVIESIYIYPGFSLSKNSLINNADLLSGETILKKFSGEAKVTEDCIDLAIFHGTNGAIKEIIEQIKINYQKKFNVILTGGDSHYFNFSHDIRDDNLLLKGLNQYIEERENE